MGCPSRRNPTWGSGPIRPLTIFFGEGRKGKRGGKEGGGRIASPSFSLPLLLSPSYSASKGGATAHAGCCVSPLGPIGPYSLPG